MADPNLHPNNNIRQAGLISVVIVAVGIGIFFLTRRDHTPVATTNSATAKIAAVTPQSYSTISGTIVAANPAEKTVIVDFAIITGAGTNEVKKYTVTASADTTIQTVTQSTATAKVTTVDFNQLAVGDQINAVGDTNIAELDAFTATTILKLIP